MYSSRKGNSFTSVAHQVPAKIIRFALYAVKINKFARVILFVCINRTDYVFPKKFNHSFAWNNIIARHIDAVLIKQFINITSGKCFFSHDTQGTDFSALAALSQSNRATLYAHQAFLLS